MIIGRTMKYEHTTKTKTKRTTKTTQRDGSETTETVITLTIISETYSKRIRDKKYKIPTVQSNLNSLINQISGNIISHYLINMLEQLKQLFMQLR